MALAVVIFLLVVGSIIFHFASPWWFTDIATDWGSIDFTINVTFWVTGFVFVACNVFLAYCIWKFRKKPGHKAVYEPENTKLEAWLSIFTTVGVVAMLAPGLFVWATFVTPPDNALEYEVLGQQWQWQFRYPGADGILGTADTGFVSESNPFGVNPEDPNGMDDVVVNDPDMHLAVNQPVKALLRSNDVLHNYTVPQFRVKMDLVPGLVSYLWFDPTKEGTYDIMCEELCGIGHFVMRGSVTVESQAAFDSWLASQPTFVETQNATGPDIAAGQAQYAACAACHGANGEGNQALNAPKIAGQQPWYIERQLNHFKQGARGGDGDTNGSQMTAFASMLTTDEAVRNISAYIATFPDNPAPTTISGDIANGYDIYDRNCAACHLDNGAGVWYTDAPKLAGMSDWYFVTQISNFRAGIRGLHADDDYGEQMVQMATAMGDLDEIEDVAAYINTLR
jgi:cytochrome c oxidase subunit 2|tara:strand:- start:2261 stop:3616 length:1356 start_codon:yes stop_codon:yes gene_type:complete